MHLLLKLNFVFMLLEGLSQSETRKPGIVSKLSAVGFKRFFDLGGTGLKTPYIFKLILSPNSQPWDFKDF